MNAIWTACAYLVLIPLDLIDRVICRFANQTDDEGSR